MIKISKFYGEMRGKGEGENTPPPPIYYWNKEMLLQEGKSPL